MYLGERRDLRETITAAAAFTVGAPAISVYDASGTLVFSGTPDVDDATPTAQVLSWPFTPTATGRYTAIFEITVGDEVRRFTQTFAVDPAVPRYDYAAAAEAAGIQVDVGLLPTAGDLAAYIISLQLIEEEDLPAQLARMDLDRKAGVAKDDFVQRTGWKPFEPTNAKRYFDPPGREPGHRTNGGRVLDLGAGLISLTELRVGVVAGSEGTALVENQSFRLGPYNAAEEGEPYTFVEFGSSRGFYWPGTAWGGAAPRSITISGTWGYQDTVPNDAWQAVLHKALLLCKPALALYVSGGVYLHRSLNSETRFAGGNASPLFAEEVTWLREYEKAVRTFRRISLG